MQHKKDLIITYLSYFFGLSSLIIFILFLFLGQFHLINFGMTENRILLLDAFLSFIFFIQHSVMIRRTIQKIITDKIGTAYYGAFYSIVSGITLIIIIIFWQKSPEIIFSAESIFYRMMRVFFFLSLAGFYWGINSLTSFDPFGVIKIKRKIHNKSQKSMPLSIKGAYKWMRHPLYFFIFVMIWTCPELSADRLLLNILWSTWIIIGAKLEERDLISEFGDQYREYQKKVPMLIPYKIL